LNEQKKSSADHLERARIIGSIWLLVELGFLKGTPGPNRFGPPVTD
jgi:hypothetical protein